jgi:hypothetical protein
MKILLSAIALALVACSAPETTQHETPPPAATTTSVPKPEPAPVAPACTDAPNRLCPRDEAANDPSFQQFRERMTEAVAQKDKAKLTALIDPKIRTSFGAGGGIGSLDMKPDSKLWRDLDSILKLGGAFKGGTSFWAPYVYSNWPDAADVFTHVAVIHQGVALHLEPKEDTGIGTGVDYEIVEVIPQKNPDWLNVRTSGGREGWVPASDVRSPIGLRAGFIKEAGEWKMNALVAGD